MSAESPGARNHSIQWRQSFREWRWQRPFWAGVLTVLGGLPIAYLPYHNLTFGQLQFRIGTTTGSASLIIGVLLVVLGLSMWFQPAVRVFAGVASILLGLVSLVVSNFGGLVVGFLFALFGGGMSVAWEPGEASGGQPAKGRRRAPKGTADGVGDANDAKDADGVARFEGPNGTDGVDDKGAEDGENTPEPAGAGTAPEQETMNGRHRAG
ncbi:DUF6114 domain-containing protein [Streptomyces sp. SAJ15]|uniref:DUF6114 domain-containing protein n=1 Tax=Streptomyces sp. SAJ15 TaxID=2011095 RepID=UPI001185B526|nr:DUF6114 domain-containing protein [Streptomyces sp. SAJ15]TVL94215.1 hypothetical protein CD790_04295 [Streptomyces sp. SAJ15]